MSKTNTSLNRNYTPLTLLKFAAPSIIMMIFMSLYTIVDGIFISRYVGGNALSSLNIVYPALNVVIAVALMLSTGGNAIISKYLGEGRDGEARQCLTQFVVVGLIFSVVAMSLSLCFPQELSRFLGSNDILMDDCCTYLRIVMAFAPVCMLQTLFQAFLVTAGYPHLGMYLTLAAGVINIVLDYVFVAVMTMGVGGAALATGIGQTVPAVAGIIFFALSRRELRFSRFKFRWREMIQACYNGSSEMVSELSCAIVTFLFNIILMRMVGEHGVAAVTILLYGQFVFNAFYIGFSIGIGPVVGFQFGAGNREQLRKIYKVTVLFVGISSVALTVISLFAATPIVSIFTKEPAIYELAVSGFRIFAFNFLFSGLNIISSGLFTALSNGKISAIISFARTLGFIVISLIVLPEFLGVDGVWAAVPVAEFLTLLMCAWMHRRYFLHPGPANYILE